MARHRAGKDGEVTCGGNNTGEGGAAGEGGVSRICRELAGDSRVKDVVVASGEYDLMILVEGENIDELSEFVTDKLAPKRRRHRNIYPHNPGRV